jgi:hypothetical protein
MDPRIGTTIEWPPHLQTLLTPNAMRVVNRSRLIDPAVLVSYWEKNISSPASERSVVQSLLKEQQRAQLMLSMIDKAIDRSREITAEHGTSYLWDE